jgi:hypothetical protein
MLDRAKMDRRVFVKGLTGALASVSLGGLAILQSACAAHPEAAEGEGANGGPALTNGADAQILHTTATGIAASDAAGPVMTRALALSRGADGIEAWYEGMHVFTVDELGLELVRRADGTRSILDIASELGMTDSLEAVSLFFVSLGMAGWLENTVLVALVQNAA